MTDPVESLARALTDVMFPGRSWTHLSADARAIAMAETRQALSRAAGDVAEAIAEHVVESIGHDFWCDSMDRDSTEALPCDCRTQPYIDAIRGWRP